MLEKLGIEHEVWAMSAHRNAEAVREFVGGARDNGFGVIIAAAGMAAHLAGACAANTTLPVIGVPVSGGALDGVDALYSTVQMPPGMPVATVAINGAGNAGLLAAQILSIEDDELAKKLADLRSEWKPKRL
jgi:5-(carboxyamino)imidazole ribonucleotide mutase